MCVFRKFLFGLGLLGWCVLSHAEVSINAGLAGSWFEPETTGQGVFIDVIPSRNQMVVAWFTYDPNHPAPGAAPVKWYTALGGYQNNVANLDVFETTGGRFDESTDVNTELVGFISIEFESCAAAKMTYDMTSQSLTGEILLQRITPDVFCDGITNDIEPDNKRYNLPPVLNQVNALVLGDEIEIRYDVVDAEKDWLDLQLIAVNNSGDRYLIKEADLYGHYRYPVFANNNQWIRWRFKNDDEFIQLDWSEFKIEITADDRWISDIEDIIEMVDEGRLIRDIQNLQYVRHRSQPAGLERARNYIRAEMNAMPVERTEVPFAAQGTNGINIIAQSTLLTQQDSYYIIDGHYDTVATTPGADDNASGTAGMLEAMRVLSQFNSEHGIQFIGFDQEELGLVGSRFHAREVNDPSLIKGLINFEMIGYPCRGEAECRNFPNADDSIYNIRSSFATTLSDAFMFIGATYVPELEIDQTADDGDSNFRRSDHAPFWDLGIDALFIADGANFRTPHYHQATDLLPTMDTEFMTQIVKVAVGTLAQEAGVHHTSSMETNLIQLESN